MDEFAPATTTPAVPAAGFTREPVAGGELPDPFQLLDETLKEFMANLGPYVLAGLGQMVFVFPVVFIAIIGLYALMFGGVFGGMAVVGLVAAVLPEDLAGLVVGLGSLALPIGLFGITFLVIGGMSVVLMPTAASLARAVARHQRGEDDVLGFTSAFDSATQDVGSVITAGAVVVMLSIMGAMMCYFPAFAVLLFLGFAMNMVALHREGGVAAITTVFAHARQHLPWHGKFTLLYLVLMLVAGNVPIIGPMFAVALHVRAYRRLFGDGDTAVLHVHPA
ncbi:MAG: hypothetical protein ACI8PZ_000029 [Myxococcota bacterium]|jgi:hypothetical protein